MDTAVASFGLAGTSRRAADDYGLVVGTQRGYRTVWQSHPALHHLAAILLRLGIGQPAAAIAGYGDDHRENSPGHIRAAGRRVVVGGVVQRLHRGEDRLTQPHAVGVIL